MRLFDYEELDQRELGGHWKWFLVLGFFMIVVGILAVLNSVAVTVFSMIFLGWIMIFAGFGETVHAFWKKNWGGVFLHLGVGVLYLVVGFMVLTNPEASAVTLSLIMALFFIVTGIFRFGSALAMHYPNRVWELLNGLITFVLGMVIWQKPLVGLWLIGIFVGVDLIISGWAWLMLSLAARRLTQA